MSSRTAARVTLAAAVAVIGIVASHLTCTRPAWAARSQQTATPRPPAQGIAGTLPRCTSTASIEPSTVDVRVGDVVTITARSRVVCPELLRSRGVLFVIGGVPASAVPSIRNALAGLVEAVGAAGGGRIARLLVGADTAVPAWASTDVERAAVANALRGLEARRGGTALAWSAAIARADAAFAALPFTVRPLLVVVDGLAPEADLDRAGGAIVAAIQMVRDRVGNCLLIDISNDGWLAVLPRLHPALLDMAIFVRSSEGAERSVSNEVDSVIAAFQAPLSRWLGTLGAGASLAVMSAAPEPEVRGDVTKWSLPAEGHDATIVVRTTYRAILGPPRAEIVLLALPLRRGMSLEREIAVRLVLCVQPPSPGRVICPDAARATPTAIGSPPPTPLPPTPGTPTAAPSTTPSRMPSATPAPRTPLPSAPSPPRAAWRVFIPVASHG